VLIWSLNRLRKARSASSPKPFLDNSMKQVGGKCGEAARANAPTSSMPLLYMLSNFSPVRYGH
jgi:hypothetical protein